MIPQLNYFCHCPKNFNHQFVVINLSNWKILVINYGNWKLVTKFFVSVTHKVHCNPITLFSVASNCFLGSPTLFWPRLTLIILGWSYNYYNNVMQGCTNIQIHPSRHDVHMDAGITLTQSSIHACITWLKNQKKEG